MKRGWLALLEVGVSILLMTTFFLYLQSYAKTGKSIGYFDPDLYRNLTANCSKYSNLVYYFNNFTYSTYCVYGKSKKFIKGFQLVGQYLYSGYKKYAPKIIEVYK